MDILEAMCVEVANRIRAVAHPELGKPSARRPAGTAVGGDATFEIDRLAEEVVTEFVDEVRAGCTYQYALQEMNHIRQDMDLLRTMFTQYPQLLQYPAVYNEWRHVKTAYRNLDHEMYHWVAGRWNASAVATLKKDLAELDAAHVDEK